MVTMVMMIVISLIVLGFAEISRTEQRNTLDSQLSVQAYYAAESGINDARAAINNFLANGQSVPDKTGCDNQDANYSLSGTVNASFNVSYSCVLISSGVTSLTYNVGYSSTVVPINTGSVSVGNLQLGWKVPSGLASTATGCFTDVSQLGSWPVANGGGQWSCNYPVLRVDLLDANGTLIRANWHANTTTMFLVPFDSASVNNNVNFGANGTPVPAQCDATSCIAQIGGLGGSNYYMRVTTLYRTDSSLTITTNPSKTFYNAQATIDATGKAQDVLRRVLVAVDLTDANARKVPSAAIITEDSICKRYGITSGSFNVYDDMSSGGGGNPLCNLQSVGTPSP